MQEMIDFSVAMLGALADFFREPPMFYLFCLLCFCPVVKAFKELTHF